MANLPNTTNTQPSSSASTDPANLKLSATSSIDPASLKFAAPSSPTFANLNRQVFNKQKFNDTIDTSFSQLVSPVDPSFFDINLATVEDFFTLYVKFFYEIPKEGGGNSHTYLIQESSDYVNYQPNQEEIEALLEEIADLRTENLELRNDLVQITNTIGEVNDAVAIVRDTQVTQG